MGGKAKDVRNRKAAAAKGKEDDEPLPQREGSLPSHVIGLFMGSCLLTFLPKLPGLLQAPEGSTPPKKKEEGDEVIDSSNGDAGKTLERSATAMGYPAEVGDSGGDAPAAEGAEVTAAESPGDAGGIFEELQTRLTWNNCLGLKTPRSGKDAMEAWISTIEAWKAVDFGPKSKKGAAAFRLYWNIHDHLNQYLHCLLGLVCLRAFLFRSWFACLPWLVGYQYLSLILPMDNHDPIPFEKVPTKFRVAATLGIHALVWFFFVYEMLTFWMIPLAGLVGYHAYATKPLGHKQQD